MSEMDQRRHPRVPVEIGAQIQNESGRFLGRVLNLSMGGLFMKVPTLFPEGMILKVQFQLPDPEGTVELKGQVVWSSRIEDKKYPVFGTGIEFCEILPAFRDRIYHFVSNALKSHRIYASKAS